MSPIPTVCVDTNVFTAWLNPRSPLLGLYSKHIYGRRLAISQQTLCGRFETPAMARGSGLLAGFLASAPDRLGVDRQPTWDVTALREAGR